MTRLYHGPFVNGLSGSVVSNITPVLPPPKMRWGGAIGNSPPKTFVPPIKSLEKCSFQAKQACPWSLAFGEQGKHSAPANGERASAAPQAAVDPEAVCP